MTKTVVVTARQRGWRLVPRSSSGGESGPDQGAEPAPARSEALLAAA